MAIGLSCTGGMSLIVCRKRALSCLFALSLLFSFSLRSACAEVPSGPLIVLTIESTINPATADYLRSGLQHAATKDAKLVILHLNTPGGLLPSMQLMVESLLQSKVPTVVYISPQGAGGMSAGMFITLAGNFAVMAPGTMIGAAHPVLNGGKDITGDMGQKIENFSVSLAKAIAEQRGRNVKWAEEAVRESVAATATEAQAEGVIDFVAADYESIFSGIEGKTINCAGRQVTMQGLREAAVEKVPMSLKQTVLNYLADPNIAMLLGMGALLGLAVELYHPGAIFPGVFGAICLIFSLIAGQVLPIAVGGVVLMLLGAAFCIAEVFVPTLGALGIVGTICVAVGAIYAIDEKQVFSAAGFEVDRVAIFGSAFVVASALAVVARMVFSAKQRKVTTGREGLVGREAKVIVEFSATASDPSVAEGKVTVMGEIWRARINDARGQLPKKNDILLVKVVENDMSLTVETKRLGLAKS